MDTLSQTTRNPFLGLVLVGGILYIAGQYVGSLPAYKAQALDERPRITVQGHGEIDSRPDVGTIQFGVNTEPWPTSEEATTELAEKMNAIINFLKGEGVEDKDIKTTNLSVNPTYDFTQSGRELLGYEAQQTVTVTLREIDRAGELISGASALGANQIGGIQFTIDEDSALALEAQKKAIEDARQQAEQMATALDAKLGRIVTFDSSLEPPGQPILFDRATAQGSPEGGLEVPPGENTTTANVTITYELEQ